MESSDTCAKVRSAKITPVKTSGMRVRATKITVSRLRSFLNKIVFLCPNEQLNWQHADKTSSAHRSVYGLRFFRTVYLPGVAGPLSCITLLACCNTLSGMFKPRPSAVARLRLYE